MTTEQAEPAPISPEYTNCPPPPRWTKIIQFIGNWWPVILTGTAATGISSFLYAAAALALSNAQFGFGLGYALFGLFINAFPPVIVWAAMKWTGVSTNQQANCLKMPSSTPDSTPTPDSTQGSLKTGNTPAVDGPALGTNAPANQKDWSTDMFTRNDELLKRVTARPGVFNGKPIIRDMRISVEMILSLLSQGASYEELMDDYPELQEADILACIAYAHTVIAGDSLAQVSVRQT